MSDEISRPLSDDQRVSISKTLSFMLRHQPEEFGLEVDKYGFAYVDEVVAAIHERRPWFTAEHLEDVLAHDVKKRFQIVDDKIRARYAHSIPVEQPDEAVEPPEVLYHGIPRGTVEGIQQHGLEPMGRQYVHLSISQEDAIAVGKRRDDEPASLIIKAREAHQAGIKFFHAGTIYLCDSVPPQFIEVGK